ncbi:rhomboid family intramembrane serine protease [Simiduia sp. 21SJ11W-1]|uniref:rhomboid family intramembrane serine protease n=1 Tax=Simiduia sp. 21SJ11W-1 TaxID=2909669 RepID=UPI00209DB0D0|nr:rhomboid family intramembrane serine protease [Simiduia sp. 21SJ11W-1]UTA49347.1 rhomboid family intramembrane serine protease [Simiduia sp. 21SJ11W-1]
MSNQWFCAERLPLDVNLAPVINALRARAIPCWVSEEAGRQCIWLQAQAHLPILAEILQAAGRGELEVDSELEIDSKPAPMPRVAKARQWPPVTLCLLVLSALGALLVEFDQGSTIAQLTFTEARVRGNALYFSDLASALEQGQWWRLLTPMFLHFDFFHLLFNSLWVWEFGRRIELQRSGLWLISLTLFASLGANFMQYAMSGPSLFGGMSGVLYGYVGYILVWARLWPAKSFGVAPGILGFMLIWLVLCFTGAVDTFIDGEVANGAHLGGLLGGLLFGFLDVLRAKLLARN